MCMHTDTLTNLNDIKKFKTETVVFLNLKGSAYFVSINVRYAFTDTNKYK